MSLHSVKPTLRDSQAERSYAHRSRARQVRRSKRNGALDISLRRFCDVIVALVTIMILLPAMLIIAVLIKGDSRGPVAISDPL